MVSPEKLVQLRLSIILGGFVEELFTFKFKMFDEDNTLDEFKQFSSVAFAMSYVLFGYFIQDYGLFNVKISLIIHEQNTKEITTV